MSLLWWSALLLPALTLVSASAEGVAVPLSGSSLSVKAAAGDPDGRSLKWKSGRELAVAAPLPDPTAGASLFLFSSNDEGQCRAEITLPAEFWSAVKGDGASRGWRYKDKSGSAGGVRTVRLQPGGKGGRVTVKAKGSLPCGLEAASQVIPFQIELRVGEQRYCSSFGGDVKKNQVGSFKAKKAPALGCPDRDLTAASLNILHGLFCPPETDFCRVGDRVDLLGEWLVARGCPGVVGLQEVFSRGDDSLLDVISERLTDVCPVPYQVVFHESNGLDDSLFLTRHGVLDSEVVVLHQSFRNVLWARLDHPIGPVDVMVTHLASGSDNGAADCAAFRPCPAECISAGAVTIRDCQAEQVAVEMEARHDNPQPALVMGDMNAEPGSFVHATFTARGWPDTTTAVALAECDPATGLGCTSGREDQALTDLEATPLGVDRRIDFLFLVPPAPGSPCSGSLDDASDADGDGVATRLFAEEPNPFAPSCGPLPDPICFVSDHSGAQADVNCED
jgi:endonuclease/exonuclease/phosphatase family metal-dependent hydrolase